MRLAIALGVCILLFGSFGGDHGLPATWQARRDRETLAARLAALRTENAQLRRRLEQLRSDPSAIEAEARASLGLARPGEIVVIRSR